MKLYNWLKFNESTESIESICKKYGINYYTIENGLVNCKGDGNDVNLFDWLSIGDNGVWGNWMKKLPLNFGEISGNFKCNNNILTTLIGSPYKVGGNFDSSTNLLTSLEGSPKIIMGYFSCSQNNITSLVGGPKDVWGGYYCHNNYLCDVRGFPEFYRGRVEIDLNPVFEIISLFKGVDKDIIIETLNDYNVIRPGNKVNLQLLKYAFDDLEIVMPEIEYIKGYEII